MYQVTLLDKTSTHQVRLFLDLLLNSFKRKQDYYEWKHNLNNDFEIEEYTFCIFKDDLCIATTQAIINEVMISGIKYRFGLLCDGATHKDYRRLGLFENLLSHINEYSEKNDVTFVYSTGNEKSRKALLKLGFEDFFTTLKASKKIRYNHPMMKFFNVFLNIFGMLTIKKFDNTKEISLLAYSSFYNNQKSKYDVCYEKSESYLKWRFSEPNEDYKFYGSFDDRNILQAVIVLKKTKDLLYIVDAHYNDNSVYLDQLLKHISGFAIKDKSITKVHCSHSNFINLKDIFQKNSFKITKEGSSALLYTINPDFSVSDNELRNMHYMRIDKNE